MSAALHLSVAPTVSLKLSPVKPLPVQPGYFVVLAVGIIVAALAVAELVARRQLSLTEASALVREIAAGQTTGIFRHAALDHPAWLRRAHELAVTITPIANVRALALLHVAAAQLLGRTRLLTFDVNQRRAARAAGLSAPEL